MARPTLSRAVVTRLGDDGRQVRGIEFMFGTPGSPGHFRSTLWDDWDTKTPTEQTTEMNRRYDEWMAFVTAAKTSTPTAADLRAQLDAIDDNIRQLQHQRLDVEQQLADVERLSRPKSGV